MQNTMVKVYGFLRPCDKTSLDILREALGILGDEACEVLLLQGELLNVSYEGIFFPIEDFIETLASLVNEESAGKVDYIDMEGWSLTRYSFDNGFITSSKRGLNDVLDHAGH